MPRSRHSMFLGLGMPDHGDARLDRRQVEILSSFVREAGRELTAPQAIGSEAGMEAYYRLLRNERVEPTAILKPHVDEVYRQIPESWLVVAHDRTNVPAGPYSEEGSPSS